MAKNGLYGGGENWFTERDGGSGGGCCCCCLPLLPPLLLLLVLLRAALKDTHQEQRISLACRGHT